MTVFILTHPVNFPCERKPEHPEKTHDFRQSVDGLFSHESVTRIEPTNSEVKGACSYDRSYNPILASVSIGSLQVSRGQVTFDSEGNDNQKTKYFSREPHVPSSASGITIGRGYDLKERKQQEVYQDLLDAGIPESTAKKISGGVDLKGKEAKNYLKVKCLVSIPK